MKTACNVCGAELSAGAVACWGCGAVIGNPSETQAPSTAATPAPGTPAAPPKPIPPATATDAQPAAAVPDAPAPSPAVPVPVPPQIPAPVPASAPPAAAPAPVPALLAPAPIPPPPASGGGFRPAWLFGIAAILVACAAILWVILHFTVGGGGGPSRGESPAVRGDGPLTRRGVDNEGTSGPWGQPWGGEHVTRGDQAIDPEALPWKGSEEPLVALVEFGDYECEFTRRADGVVDRVLARFGREVRLVFVHHPLPIHDHALLAAQAAEAARLQGRFGEMHARLLDARGVVDRDDVVRLARSIGLDVERFERDLRGEARESVAAMVAFAKARGLTATPHFVIGGMVIEGAKVEAIFVEAIEKALAEARRRVDGGTSRADVYEESLAFLAK